MSLHLMVDAPAKSMAQLEQDVARAIFAAVQAVGVSGNFDDLPAEHRQQLLNEAGRAIAGRIGLLDHDARGWAVDIAMGESRFQGLSAFTMDTAQQLAQQALLDYDGCLLAEWRRFKAAKGLA